MWGRFAAGVGLSVACSAFASPSQWRFEMRHEGSLEAGCAAEISVGIGRRLCVNPALAENEAQFALREGEQLAYVEGTSSTDIGRVVARFPGITIRVVTSDEYQHLRADEQLFVMPLELEVPGSEQAPLSRALSVGTPGSSAPLVQRDTLRSFLEVLVGDRAYEATAGKVTVSERFSSQGRKTTREVLVDHFQRLGLRVRTQCYGSGSSQGCNVEAILDGVEKENPIVIGAHYDSVTMGAADDNGTGTAALMEFARLFAGRKFRKSIAFVAFDEEEAGLVGSSAYVKDVTSAKATTPSLAIAIDTMGYDKDNDGKMHLIDCGRAESRPLTEAFLSEKTRLGFNLTNVEKCTNRSDHASFWRRNIPAIIVSENFFGGDANPCYHKKCDTIATMNFDYYATIAETVAHTVETLAGE
jgi:hypothetical protein